MTTTNATNLTPPRGDSAADERSKLAGGVGDTPYPGAASSPSEHPQGDVLSRVVQGAHHTIDRVADTAAPHLQRLQEGVDSASQALHEGTDHTRELGEAWTESMRNTVREHPLAAVAAALLAGLVIARLTR